MSPARESIAFRPQADADLAFLLELYGSTREDELRLLAWTAQQKDDFVRMQFHAQKTHYEQHYSDCEFLIIEQGGERIGRLYVRRAPAVIFVIDIALCPPVRGGGIGTMLMRELMDEAARTGRRVGIHVEFFNPALRLYERLGFTKTDTHGVYFEMEWRSPEG